MNLTSALELSDGEVVALVGAGGKTKIMFALARELTELGKKVVVTTTTKIMTPTPAESPSLLVEDNPEKALSLLREELQRYAMVAIGTKMLSDGKLVGIPPEWVKPIQNLPDVSNVLVEADGAAGKPLKAPKEYEPVIPENSSLVISIAGIDALGKELTETNVHRADRVAALTSLKSGDIITAEAIAQVMLNPRGNVKGSPERARIIPLVNKVDNNSRLEGARAVAKLLIKKGARRVILAHATFQPVVVEVVYG